MTYRKWLAAAVLLALPVIVWAQAVVQDGQSFRGQLQGSPPVHIVRADSTAMIPTVTSSGATEISDISRDRDLVYTWSDIIPNDSLKAAGDSSAVIDLQGAKHLWLCLKGCPKGPHGQAFSNVALQFRIHINDQTDSMSTMPIYITQQSNVGIAVTAASDTVHAGHLAVGTATVPWSGEVVVRMSRDRCGDNGAASTALFWPQGIAIPLDGLFGRDVRLPNLSVRARIVGGPSIENFTATLIGVGK